MSGVCIILSYSQIDKPGSRQTKVRETITISIPEEFKAALDDVMREEGLSRSELVREALRDYLFLRRYRAIRAHMVEGARAQGVFSDDEVFKLVS